MKFKSFVVLSIALIMVLTLVTPALAGSSRLTLNGVLGTGETGTGTATLRATHLDQCKVSIVLQGASSYQLYHVWVYDGTDYYWAGDLATDAEGNARFSGATYYYFPSGTVNCQVALGDVGNQVVYLTDWLGLKFK